MRIIDPPGHIKSVLRQLTDYGYSAYLVGGCVRDSVMGRSVRDWDIAASATPEEIARVFPKTFLTGEKYGTVTVLTAGDAVEVTTFRADGEYHDGRRPESVEFVGSLDQDLSRRDFTVNAMAVSQTGQMIDPFGGLADIEGHVIRCVGEPDLRFGEDALRMFRAYRFSAQLGFVIEPETMRAICGNAERAKAVSAERVRVEVEKTLMSQEPEAVGQMIEAGLLDRYLTARQGDAKQGDGSSACQAEESPPCLALPSCLDLRRLALLPEEPVFRWCALCALLLEAHYITSASEFLRGLRLDAKTVKICSSALSIPGFPEDRTEIKRLLSKHGEEAVRCAAAVVVQEDKQGTSCPVSSRVEEIIESGECFTLSKLTITGSDLIAHGYSPGQELGTTLSKLLGHVIEHPEDNTREILLKIANKEGH